MSDRGCKGLASVFSHTSGTCASCSARPECSQGALDILQRVRGAINVNDMLRQFQLSMVAPDLIKAPRELSLAQLTAIASMPSKVTNRLKLLLLEGFDLVAVAALRRGENPFPRTGAKHMHLAGQLLLSGTLTKARFREECIARYGWAESTAFSEVSQALALMRGLGLTRETKDRIELSDACLPPDSTLTP